MKWLIPLLLLTSCSTGYNIVEDSFHLTVTLVEQPILNGKKVRAYAKWNDHRCDIVLTESEYPMSLEHEVRHCIEHHWH